MIHRRAVIWIMRIVTAIAVLYLLPYIPFVGKASNIAVLALAFAFVWIPFEILIKRIFPAKDWYEHRRKIKNHEFEFDACAKT